MRDAAFWLLCVGGLTTPALAQSTRILPFRYVATDRSATATLYLRPAVEIEPLAYWSAAREFRGALHVGLEDSLHPAESRRLASPINLLLSGDGVRVTPAAIALEHTNLPFSLIQLAALSPDESVRVHIRSGFSPQGVDVWVPVERAGITLEPVTRSVTGLGLAVAVVHVTLPAAAGTTGRAVRLSAKYATPEPSELTLSAGETRDVRVRSVGIGTDTVYARSEPFRSNGVAIVYDWPMRFFAVSLCGGLFGSLVARYGARRRGNEASHRAYSLAGLGTGTLVAVAFAVGVNLTGFEIPARDGEAVGFLVAALGAIFGLSGGVLGRAISPGGRALGGARG